MAITTLLPVPQTINIGVSAARQQTMLSLIGNPCVDYSAACRHPTHDGVASLIVADTIGRLKVRGLHLAVASLRHVLAEIEQQAPDVYGRLGHAGMLCARLVRGSATAISNHSWGTAIDLTLDGQLDRRGDGLVPQGLVQIAPIFNRHGWYWGAGFRTEDAMHFECSDGLVRQWAAQGAFGPPGVFAVPDSLLMLGDRGPDVAHVQAALNKDGARLRVDGDFGHSTRAAVIAFQARHGLVADGVVGMHTQAALQQ